MSKTTKAHFELFQEECRKWIDFFGLKDWEVNYEHKADKDNLAGAYINLEGKIATFHLAIGWYSKPNDYEVRKCSFHEVCEVLLGRLQILAEKRFTTLSEINESVHDVIRRLENTLFEKETTCQ